MNPSAIFIARPVATILLTIGIILAGMFAYVKLPVSPLPSVDFPVIMVQAQLPGASPETVATSVATPLERHLGQIADVNEMTSTSSTGSARIILQFALSRDIDGAARDVQAAINAARADLPASLRSNPIYRKFNPADSPVLILSLTSQTLSSGQMYDAAATILQQRLSQLPGVGQVNVGGSSLPAVRVELNPTALFKYGISLEDVRAAIGAANARSPKGAIENGTTRWQIYTNDQSSTAAEYRPLIVAYRKGAAVRLTDVATVDDSVEDIRNLGITNGQPSVTVVVYRQPNANIIDTVDGIKAALPQLLASLPRDITVNEIMNRTTMIRGALLNVQETLLISIVLVILTVFVFLRSVRATIIPSIAVPVSLIGTFGIMYLLGFSLNNLSLMALTVSTGFVVDDAIVVLENITRHVEAGKSRLEAALIGSREVGFTVVSMSLSLVAVFLPILLMGGIVGRLFKEFALTLSVAILVSLLVSLTTTPMLCSFFIKRDYSQPGRFSRALENGFAWMLSGYERSLRWALAHGPLLMLILLGTVCLNFYLYAIVPKGFFPDQDTGQLRGNIVADQSISFPLMKQKLSQAVAIIQHDPGVAAVTGSIGGNGGPGGGGTNQGQLFVSLKSPAERNVTGQQIITRLRPRLLHVAGASTYLFDVQDVRAGGRSGNAQYQYTLEADDLPTLMVWGPKLTAALQKQPVITDVSSDQQDSGLETELTIDRDTASRLGLSASQIDNTLYDAFGQRQVSTIYAAMNQYHVIMEVEPRFWQSPEALKDIYISTSGGAISGSQSTNSLTAQADTSTSSKTGTTLGNSGSSGASLVRNQLSNSVGATGKASGSTGSAVSTTAEKMVPLSAISHYESGTTPLSVNHQGLFAATTISFNLAEGKSLSDATTVISDTMNQIGMPSSVQGSFAGTAQSFQQSQNNTPLVILAALMTIYIVLGILYESYIHPITILSTLPSAGVGAVLALLIFHVEFSIISLIGVILLIGIVKKNAIMMIDVALEKERKEGMNSRDAIYAACVLRFRPIMMTTSAALFGAVPLAIGLGNGGELRQPLGISIVGGLILSQMLTLYTTPVVYLYLDRFRFWLKRMITRLVGSLKGGRAGGIEPKAAE